MRVSRPETRPREQSGSSDVSMGEPLRLAGVCVTCVMCHQITSHSADSIFVVLSILFPPSLYIPFWREGKEKESQGRVFSFALSETYYIVPSNYRLFFYQEQKHARNHVNNCSYVYFGKRQQYTGSYLFHCINFL